MKDWMKRHPVKRNALVIAALIVTSLLFTPTGAVIAPGLWYDVQLIVSQGTSVLAGMLAGFTVYNLVKEYRSKPKRPTISK